MLQGQTFGIYLSADQEESIQLTVDRVGAGDERKLTVPLIVGRQEVPENAAEKGCGWRQTTELQTGLDWPSGLYRVAADGSLVFHIVVRAAAPGGTSPILLMYPTTTGHAYNDFGGGSLYEAGPRNQVSFDRPRGLEYDTAVPFARWFDCAHIPTEACAGPDLHADAGLLANYRLVVSMGHDEYWSREMRDAVEAFVTRGGNAAFFSGNTCWWQVRFKDSNRTMVCYKDAAADPLTGVDDSRVTVNWADAPVYRPENALTGVGWRRGAMLEPGVSLGAVCRFPDHWAFEQTGLAEGEVFGAGFFGYETDACDYVEILGRPRATARDGTPSSFVILATADYSAPGPRAPGFATVGTFRRGGTVFTGASIGWGDGLAAGDAALDRITRNVVARLVAPAAAPAWEPAGEANDVTAMAGEAGRLYAATAGGLLWTREATAQNLRWMVFGQAAAVVAMGANGYAKPMQQQPLYAIDANGRLWRRPLSDDGTWSDLGTGHGCTALAVGNDGVVYATDPASTLWTWTDAAGWAEQGPAGLAVRCLAAHYRSLLACDRDGSLWRRDLNYLGPWERLGDAVPGLTAMAATQGALFAATDDGRLWHRELLCTTVPQPSRLDNLLVPGRVVGDFDGTGTVVMGLMAPESGALVVLGSSDPDRISVPASVTVAPGATRAQFWLAGGTEYGPVTISASYGGTTLRRRLTHAEDKSDPDL